MTHILITGAAGMIGRKLTERLASEGKLNGKPIETLTLLDVVPPEKPARFAGAVETRAADLAAPGEAAKAVAPKPVNLLMSSSIGFTVTDIAELGVRRISVGGTLARVAWNAVMHAAREIAERGKFDSFTGVVGNAELNALFKTTK